MENGIQYLTSIIEDKTLFQARDVYSHKTRMSEANTRIKGEDLLNDLETLAAVIPFLKEDFEPETKESIFGFLAEILNCAERIKAIREHESLGDFNQSFNLLDKNMVSLTSTLRPIWNKMIKRHFSDSEKLAEALGKIDPSFNPNEIINTAQEGGKHKTPFPPSDLQAFRRIYEKMAEHLQNLHNLDSGQTLLPFLKKVSLKTATLEDVNAEVLEELREKDALKLFNIAL